MDKLIVPFDDEAGAGDQKSLSQDEDMCEIQSNVSQMGSGRIAALSSYGAAVPFQRPQATGASREFS